MTSSVHSIPLSTSMLSVISSLPSSASAALHSSPPSTFTLSMTSSLPPSASEVRSSPLSTLTLSMTPSFLPSSSAVRSSSLSAFTLPMASSVLSDIVHSLPLSSVRSSTAHSTSLSISTLPMTSSVLSLTVHSKPLPASTLPTKSSFLSQSSTISPLRDINFFLGNYTSPETALEFAARFFRYLLADRPFANNVTVLQASSMFLNHWAAILENSGQEVDFLLVNQSAFVATQIVEYITAARATSMIDYSAMTISLRSLDRIYAIVAGTLTVAQSVRYASNSNVASTVSAYSFVTGVPTGATTLNGVGFTSLDGVLASSGLGENGSVIFSTFKIVQNNPFSSSRFDGRGGVKSELVGLTLRRKSPDGNVTILTVKNLGPEKEINISLPINRSLNRTDVFVLAKNVTSFLLNLTQMKQGDALTVQFFEIPENLDKTIDVYFIQLLPEAPPLRMSDLTVSLPLSSSIRSPKLFYSER